MVTPAALKHPPAWFNQAKARAGLIAGLVVLGAVGWQGGDYYRQSWKLKQAVAALRQAVTELPPAGPGINEDLAGLEQELKKKFPSDLDLAGLEQEVRGLAGSKGVALLAFEPLLGERYPGYRLQPIRLKLMGPARQVAELAKALQTRTGLQQVIGLRDQGEGDQHELRWDWFLSLPGPEGADPCPEKKDPIELPALKSNLFRWLLPQMRRQLEEADSLKESLRKAKEKVREDCRRRVQLEDLKGRQAQAQALEQKLIPFKPAPAE